MFTFKQFTIHQDKCAMKVGTDGVLLGAWAEAREGNVLDVGTGTGLIALMIAQRTSSAHIHALEIVPEAACQAQDNVNASPWSDRLTVECIDVRKYAPTVKYDEIISNPPFYEYSPSASSSERNQARRMEHGFFEQLISFAVASLAADGVFEVVLPSELCHDFIFQCWEKDLFLKRQTRVFTKSGKPCKRVLLSFAPSSQSPVKDELIIMLPDGTFTQQYRLLTDAFYVR